MKEPVSKEFLTDLAKKFPDAWLEFSHYIVNCQTEQKGLWPFQFDQEDKQYYTATFSSLPYPFQLGLFIQYIVDRGGCSWEIDDMFEFDLEEEIYGFFCNINDQAG